MTFGIAFKKLTSRKYAGNGIREVDALCLIIGIVADYRHYIFPRLDLCRVLCLNQAGSFVECQRSYQTALGIQKAHLFAADYFVNELQALRHPIGTLKFDLFFIDINTACFQRIGNAVEA